MEQPEQKHQEFVKCVLVGDSGVGKTRLTCARAARQRCSLSQLLNSTPKSHVPTVWAIDQYRINKDILRNSWTVVDGANVSLRLWDTFGNHHKDRRFAYGRSDVILMCFDIGRTNSLKNCRDIWHQEIRKFCPNTPIILVGCKNDIRFIYKEPEYLKHCKERSPLVRQVGVTDLIMPEQARAVAEELGLPYYETSVYTYFGVDEVFENAIRAAVYTRRKQRFWTTSSAKASRPKIQEPFCPPRPCLLEARVKDSMLNDDLAKLMEARIPTDVLFICEGFGFPSHRFLLCASSPLLLKIFAGCNALNQEQTSITKSNSEASLLSCNFGGSNVLCFDYFNDDTELLIQSGPSSPSRCGPVNESAALSPRNKPLSVLPTSTNHPPTLKSQVSRAAAYGLQLQQRLACNASARQSPNLHNDSQDHQYGSLCDFRSLNFPAIQSLKVEEVRGFDVNGRISASERTVLTCSKLITARAMAQVIRFLYKGSVDFKQCNVLELKQAAEFLDLPDLYHFVLNKLSKFSSTGFETYVKKPIQLRGLYDLCLMDGLFADVTIRLDDGILTAHKAILMCRCDMMNAMFTYDDFKEKSTDFVHFPGVSKFTFHQLLHYLYADSAPPHLSAQNCVNLIELANRLCLPRLVTLVEKTVIDQLMELKDQGSDLSETSLSIYELCQMYNAVQLEEWCMSYLSQNYNSVCRKYPKVLRNLLPENQATLNINRWPPVWYLKDYDQYQRLVTDREREERPKNLKRVSTNSSFLCFSNSKGSRHS